MTSAKTGLNQKQIALGPADDVIALNLIRRPFVHLLKVSLIFLDISSCSKANTHNLKRLISFQLYSR